MIRQVCTALLVVDCMLTAVTSVRGDTIGETHVIQYGLQALATMPCLGGEGYWSFTAHGMYQTITNEPGAMQLRLREPFDLTFTPLDPALPTYSAKGTVIDTFSPSSRQGSETLFEVPVTLEMRGSDGSTVTVSGIITWVLFVDGTNPGFGFDQTTMVCN